ncbi:PREDICTED: histone-lysine N-methyltransferase SETMAR-like [Atta colombica]|uniref:histone-lysine N-methyltransferase SETMAR-like n=1 Tax=Atta colombica TaxID=520822 RepID=UPI00084C79DA|nr:PREDICTED: histone-lysine N-methyltransferase SETMAR-like [Atta colombica]
MEIDIQTSSYTYQQHRVFNLAYYVYCSYDNSFFHNLSGYDAHFIIKNIAIAYEHTELLGCPESSCRFLEDGVRTGLNISERLKTNDMRTYRKRRHLMLFFYRKGKNAIQATNKICVVYGEGAVAEKTVRKWFARFKTSDFNLEDQELPGRPSTTDEDQIKTLIENNLRYTIRKLAEMLNMSKSIIHEHFVKLGYINHFYVWIPHDLTEKNLMDRISICNSLYKHNEETPFLKQILGKRNELPLATPKADLHPKKVMLCVWWDWKGILYYELLSNNETINSEKYCSQLDELKIEQQLNKNVQK